MKFLKIKENKDGSAIMDCELTKLELTVIKRALGVKRLTKKRMNEYILKAIIAGASRDAQELIKGVKK